MRYNAVRADYGELTNGNARHDDYVLPYPAASFDHDGSNSEQLLILVRLVGRLVTVEAICNVNIGREHDVVFDSDLANSRQRQITGGRHSMADYDLGIKRLNGLVPFRMAHPRGWVVRFSNQEDAGPERNVISNGYSF